MGLPKKITFTETQKVTKNPLDAVASSLWHIYTLSYVCEETRQVTYKAWNELTKRGSDISLCKKAFEIIMDAPAVYRDEISDNFPPELWEMLEEKCT